MSVTSCWVSITKRSSLVKPVPGNPRAIPDTGPPHWAWSWSLHMDWCPCLASAHPQAGARCQAPGVLSTPLAALLLAGVVGWILSARPWAAPAAPRPQGAAGPDTENFKIRCIKASSNSLWKCGLNESDSCSNLGCLTMFFGDQSVLSRKGCVTAFKGDWKGPQEEKWHYTDGQNAVGHFMLNFGFWGTLTIWEEQVWKCAKQFLHYGGVW